ncbi:TPA: hypothetical protein ACW4VD_003416, partial [Salmonella enterica]
SGLLISRSCRGYSGIFYTIFTRPVTTCVTTETAEIKKASRYYLLAGDFRLSPTPILSHT